MLDISLCAAKNCPRYTACYRGSGEKHAGIYTVSDFSKECDEVTNYPWYIPSRDADPFKEVAK